MDEIPNFLVSLSIDLGKIVDLIEKDGNTPRNITCGSVLYGKIKKDFFSNIVLFAPPLVSYLHPIVLGLAVIEDKNLPATYITVNVH